MKQNWNQITKTKKCFTKEYECYHVRHWEKKTCSFFSKMSLSFQCLGMPEIQKNSQYTQSEHLLDRSAYCKCVMLWHRHKKRLKETLTNPQQYYVSTSTNCDLSLHFNQLHWMVVFIILQNSMKIWIPRKT